jgi:D-3-phosphoglycerate dehydrogenase
VGSELALVAQNKWPMSVVNPSVLQTTTLQRWQPVGIGRGPNS